MIKIFFIYFYSYNFIICYYYEKVNMCVFTDYGLGCSLTIFFVMQIQYQLPPLIN